MAPIAPKPAASASTTATADGSATTARSAESREDHAPYLAGWLRVLKANAGHLWTVAGAAERAVTYVKELANPELALAQPKQGLGVE